MISVMYISLAIRNDATGVIYMVIKAELICQWKSQLESSQKMQLLEFCEDNLALSKKSWFWHHKAYVQTQLNT